MSLFGTKSNSGSTSFTFPSATSAASTSAPSLFGTSTPTKPLFGSATQTATSTPSLFASTTKNTTTTSGLFGSNTTGSSLFSKTTESSGGLFGSSAGSSLFSKPAGGGLFGTTTTTTNVNQQPQVTSQQQIIANYHPFVRACGNPQLVGNDDDKHIANLNQISAAIGVGKAPFKDNNQVQTFNMEGNCFEKFVGIGYNKVSEHSDDEGIVTMALKAEINEINSEEKKTKILETLTNILGNQQDLQVYYAPGSTLRQLPDGFTEISVVVKEGGFVVGAVKFAQVLNENAKLTQLETQLKVDKNRVLPKVGMSKTQKDKYLENSPNGIDENLWQQAIRENPAPSRMLPVAVRGWEQLLERKRAQMAESKIFKDALIALVGRIEKVENDHAKSEVEMESIRCRHKQLSYRLLRIILAQWIAQRFSRQIDTEEDQIEARCDTLLAQLNRQHQLKSCISNFYEILENNGDKLREGAQKAYEMPEEEQKYALTFLTEILYIGERLVDTNQLQYEDLESIRKTMEGE